MLRRTKQKLFIMCILFCLFSAANFARAQSCWVYTDTAPAKAPIQCVQQGDLTSSCSWDRSCHVDGDSSDCCTTKPSSSPQTIREMHEVWHDCFGNVGRSDGNNPPGRSQRWYAFHRQFEIDFNEWREPKSLLPIESLEWCPNMVLPVGHGGGNQPAGSLCGTGPGRSSGEQCPSCTAFRQCLFLGGAGPGACPTAPSNSCSIPASSTLPGLALPYTSLEQFQSEEEVATILDGYFHGIMHSAIVTPPGVNGDSLTSVCSPRDPMFWRLHKALDDVVRAWQDSKAIDVVLVLDTSGSMSSPDSTSISKLEAAVNAADLFADLLEDTRPDGQQNRIGIVTYSSGPLVRLPMTPVTPLLRASGGPFANSLNDILTTGPNGCTGIGSGIEKALELLCPPSGDCRGPSVSGANPRQAIVLLTDGVENRAPCLNPSGPTPTAACGNQCFGSALDYSKLETTQVVSVGFGSSGSLNGPLLTLVSERQGGVYLQNPVGPADDLKHFFVKAMGQVSGESVQIDPQGSLSATSPASDIVEYQSCGDPSLTITGGWDKAVAPGELRLLVTAPNGDLVVRGQPAVEHSAERLWSHTRVRMPFHGATSGPWRTQLIRPHLVIVNAFSPLAFVDVKAGTELIRNEIHRLCPSGCRRVLHFEATPAGQSVYESALKTELQTGLVGNIKDASNEKDFESQLRQGGWDLIVYAFSGNDTPQPYDASLAERLCTGQKALISDSRPKSSAAIMRCSGSRYVRQVTRKGINVDGALVLRPLKLRSPGNPQESWAIAPIQPSKTLAGWMDTGIAIVAKTVDGPEQQWFIDILGRGLSKITPVSMKHRWTTDDRILVSARILPSYNRAGGYDSVDARVEVEYPTVGLGKLLAESRVHKQQFPGEHVAGATASASALQIPTKTVIFKMNDDGILGDQYPGNAYWTTALDGIPIVDGHYKLRFMFDFSANGCTTHREANQSIFVQIGVDPERSKIDVRPVDSDGDSRRAFDLVFSPTDKFGNPLGPGRAIDLGCNPAKDCKIQEGMRDLENGSYASRILVGAHVNTVELRAFDSSFLVPIDCDTCPRLKELRVSDQSVTEHAHLQGKLLLDRPAPRTQAGGTVVFLKSSDPRLVNMPPRLLIPAGQTEASFEVSVGHLLQDKLVRVHIVASHGAEKKEVNLLVRPEQVKAHIEPARDGGRTLPRIDYPMVKPMPGDQ